MSSGPVVIRQLGLSTVQAQTIAVGWVQLAVVTDGTT
jgi:hypothetical protein